MPASRQDLFTRLAELGITTHTVEHEPLFTVAESSKLERELPGVHTKNLFLKDDSGELFLVVARSETSVDLKALAKTLRAGRFSFGKPELLMQALGVPPGSVTAFAIINDPARRVRVVIDAELMKHDSLNCHPLENTATTNIAREDLLRFIRSCGHEPRIAVLGGIKIEREEPLGPFHTQT
ncbi:MAG: prolyl-tRNA synthetase associated domain-containing protein [Hyphomicrobium sp.]